MPDDAGIRLDLRKRTGWSNPSVSKRLTKLEELCGSRTYALYLMAFRNGVRLKKFGVDDDTQLTIARLNTELATHADRPATSTRNRSTVNREGKGSRTASPSRSTGKRALMAVLFTDIVGSTAISSAMGDAKWKAVIAAHDEASSRMVKKKRGRLIKLTGDGIMAIFSDPERAIACAQLLVDAVANIGINIRSGIHFAAIEIVPGDITGIAVNVAARVMDHAGSGEILVSSTVRDIVAGSDLEFRSCGRKELKGLSDMYELFAVEG